MIKRTIEISREQVHLSVRNGQLVIQPKGVVMKDARTIPCEDIGMVVVDHPAVTCSHAALATLLDPVSVVVVCGTDTFPTCSLLPLP